MTLACGKAALISPDSRPRRRATCVTPRYHVDLFVTFYLAAALGS